MKQITLCIFVLALIGLFFASGLTAAPISDSALYNQSASRNDVSVQCGAIQSHRGHVIGTAFTVYITMTNREDLGGSDGFVRVTYQDGDFVEYAIPVKTSLQITLSGGGTPNFDQIITVSGTGGAILMGQMSLSTETGKPHRDLPGQTRSPSLYCSTQTAD